MSAFLLAPTALIAAMAAAASVMRPPPRRVVVVPPPATVAAPPAAAAEVAAEVAIPPPPPVTNARLANGRRNRPPLLNPHETVKLMRETTEQFRALTTLLSTPLAEGAGGVSRDDIRRKLDETHVKLREARQQNEAITGEFTNQLRLYNNALTDIENELNKQTGTVVQQTDTITDLCKQLSELDQSSTVLIQDALKRAQSALNERDAARATSRSYVQNAEAKLDEAHAEHAAVVETTRARIDGLERAVQDAQERARTADLGRLADKTDAENALRVAQKALKDAQSEAAERNARHMDTVAETKKRAQQNVKAVGNTAQAEINTLRRELAIVEDNAEATSRDTANRIAQLRHAASEAANAAQAQSSGELNAAKQDATRLLEKVTAEAAASTEMFQKNIAELREQLRAAESRAAAANTLEREKNNLDATIARLTQAAQDAADANKAAAVAAGQAQADLEASQALETQQRLDLEQARVNAQAQRNAETAQTLSRIEADAADARRQLAEMLAAKEAADRVADESRRQSQQTDETLQAEIARLTGVHALELNKATDEAKLATQKKDDAEAALALAATAAAEALESVRAATDDQVSQAKDLLATAEVAKSRAEAEAKQALSNASEAAAVAQAATAEIAAADAAREQAAARAAAAEADAALARAEAIAIAARGHRVDEMTAAAQAAASERVELAEQQAAQMAREKRESDARVLAAEQKVVRLGRERDDAVRARAVAEARSATDREAANLVAAAAKERNTARDATEQMWRMTARTQIANAEAAVAAAEAVAAQREREIATTRADAEARVAAAKAHTRERAEADVRQRVLVGALANANSHAGRADDRATLEVARREAANAAATRAVEEARVAQERVRIEARAEVDAARAAAARVEDAAREAAREAAQARTHQLVEPLEPLDPGTIVQRMIPSLYPNGVLMESDYMHAVEELRRSGKSGVIRASDSKNVFIYVNSRDTKNFKSDLDYISKDDMGNRIVCMSGISGAGKTFMHGRILSKMMSTATDKSKFLKCIIALRILQFYTNARTENNDDSSRAAVSIKLVKNTTSHTTNVVFQVSLIDTSPQRFRQDTPYVFHFVENEHGLDSYVMEFIRGTFDDAFGEYFDKHTHEPTPAFRTQVTDVINGFMQRKNKVGSRVETTLYKPMLMKAAFPETPLSVMNTYPNAVAALVAHINNTDFNVVLSENLFSSDVIHPNGSTIELMDMPGFEMFREYPSTFDFHGQLLYNLANEITVFYQQFRKVLACFRTYIRIVNDINKLLPNKTEAQKKRLSVKTQAAGYLLRSWITKLQDMPTLEEFDRWNELMHVTKLLEPEASRDPDTRYLNDAKFQLKGDILKFKNRWDRVFPSCDELMKKIRTCYQSTSGDKPFVHSTKNSETGQPITMEYTRITIGNWTAMQTAISAFSEHLFDQQHISFVKCVKNWQFDPITKQPVPYLLPIKDGGLPIEHDQIGFLLLDALTIDRKPVYFFTKAQSDELTTRLIRKLNLPYELVPGTTDTADTNTTKTYSITSTSGKSEAADAIYVTLDDVVRNAVGAVTKMTVQGRGNLIRGPLL